LTKGGQYFILLQMHRNCIIANSDSRSSKKTTGQADDSEPLRSLDLSVGENKSRQTGKKCDRKKMLTNAFPGPKLIETSGLDPEPVLPQNLELNSHEGLGVGKRLKRVAFLFPGRRG
jgi:hypothetical protein